MPTLFLLFGPNRNAVLFIYLPKLETTLVQLSFKVSATALGLDVTEIICY